MLRAELVLVAFARLLAFHACAAASAQDAPTPNASPPAFRLGPVHEGHVVQVGTWIDWGDGVSGELEVELPPFVTLLDRSPDRLTFAIRTTEVGPMAGAIALRRGDRKLSVAVDAMVLPRAMGQTRVLVANGPFHPRSTSDDAHYDAWRWLVQVAKLAPHYVARPNGGNWIDVGLLQRVDVVLLCEDCLVMLSDRDIALLQGYVAGGGRLVVNATGFCVGSIDKANAVLDGFGLRMHEDEGAGARNIPDDGKVRDPLLDGVRELSFRRVSPTELCDERAAALVTLDAFSDRPVVAIARTGSGGEVATLGVSIWWVWIAEAEDNARLLRNLLTRAPRDRR